MGQTADVVDVDTTGSSPVAVRPSKIADFSDAVVVATAKAVKGAIIETFDAKFKATLKKLGLECL